MTLELFIKYQSRSTGTSYTSSKLSVTDQFMSMFSPKSYWKSFIWRKIGFTDKASISKNRITNFCNNRFCTAKNPHLIVESHRHEFSINVWAAIIGDWLIGPVFLPNRLKGHNYRQFFEDNFKSVGRCLLRNCLWFMHDSGCTSSF